MGRRILLLSGPNLNLLGSREPEIYGHETLTEIVSALTFAASEAGATFSHLQSNAEHDIVDAVHQAKKEAIDFWGRKVHAFVASSSFRVRGRGAMTSSWRSRLTAMWSDAGGRRARASRARARGEGAVQAT